MSAGSVIVDFLARTGTFETDTKRAGTALKSFKKDTDGVVNALKTAFVAATGGGFVYLIKSSIDAADHLNDLSKSTGVAVETLGGIGFAASQAGSSLDGAAKAIGKLNQTLAKAASGNKEASDALRALGVDAIDPLTGKTNTVDNALFQLANTFEKAGDSPEKFRAAAATLGKQYAELVPLLSDGGKALRDNIAYYQRYGGVTKETAEKADAFNDTLGKINLLTSSFGRTLASELLTPLKGIADAFLASKEKGDGFKSTAIGIKDAFVGIASFASFVVNSLEAMSASLDGLIQKAQALSAVLPSRTGIFGVDVVSAGIAIGNSDVGKQLAAIDTQVVKRRAAAQKSYDEFVARLNNGSTDPSAKRTGRIPGIPDQSASAEAEALLKKHLDGLLRSIKNATDEQQSALAFAGRFLEGEYHDSLISLQNFFDDQSSIRKRALQVQLDEQDKIIAAEEEFARKTKNPASRVEAQDKADEARRTKTRLIVQSQQEEQLALQQNARDVLELQKAFEGVNAQVLDLRENFVAAAEIKFDVQFDALKKTFTANGNQAGLDAIATLREAAVAQAQFQSASIETGRVLDALTLKQEYLSLAQQTGAITSLEGLVKLGEANRAQIPLLEARVAAEEAIAKAASAAGTAGAADLTRKAEQARLALDRLKASADPLAESLNKTFSDDLNSALDDFVTGTKSAADAFKSFTKSVLNDILKLGSKSIAQSLIGGSGGAGGFLSGLFSSGSAQGGTSAAGGFLSSIASLFSGFFAEGGTIAPGKFGVVGERGPELAFGGISGQTINPGNRSTVQNISVNVNAQRGMDKGTALQQGRDIGAGIRQALARND